MSFSRVRLIVLSACLLLSSTLLIGCGGEGASDSPSASSSERKVGETEAEKCRKKLAGAIRRLDPEKLTLQSDPERSINGLNSWIASCAADEAGALELDEEALAVIGTSPRATARRFTSADGLYIRDAIALRQLTAGLAESRSAQEGTPEEREVARIVQSFDWVIRNISLLPPDVSRPPLSLFDVMLTGRGTAEDRAWILAELLRQQRVDAVIVRSAESPESDGGILNIAEWLVAVIDGDRSLLFSVHSGMPVHSGAVSDLKNSSIASLAELKDHPRWKESTVQLIAQVVTFSPRMLVLQDQLAAEDAVVLFEELNGSVSEIRPLLDRIIQASAELWTKDDVAVWSYPEDQAIAASALDETQQRELASLMRPFDAPFERAVQESESIEELTTVPEAMDKKKREELARQRMLDHFIRVNQSSEELFGKPSRRLLKVRIRQLMGSVDTSVLQQMQQIRLAGMEEVIRIAVPEEFRAANPELGLGEVQVFELPKLIRNVNRSSTGSSMYWTALCQLDRGEAGAAMMTLANYRRQYPEGKWKYPSLVNQAVVLIGQDRLDDATKLLQEADTDDNPERLHVQQLLQALSPEAADAGSDSDTTGSDEAANEAAPTESE